jgi:hypothetical protein
MPPSCNGHPRFLRNQRMNASRADFGHRIAPVFVGQHGPELKRVPRRILQVADQTGQPNWRILRIAQRHVARPTENAAHVAGGMIVVQAPTTRAFVSRVSMFDRATTGAALALFLEQQAFGSRVNSEFATKVPLGIAGVVSPRMGRRTLRVHRSPRGLGARRARLAMALSPVTVALSTVGAEGVTRLHHPALRAKNHRSSAFCAFVGFNFSVREIT